MRRFYFAVFFLMLGLQGMLWLEETGLISLTTLNHNIATQQQLNEQIHQRLEQLITEVEAIKEHPEALESLARKNLGMVHKEDTWYWLIPEESDNTPSLESTLTN